MRTMFDSTNPAAIPTSAELVGGYTDGIYGPDFKAIGRSATGWDAAAWARFPNSVHVLISAIGTDSGTVGDVEPGCMSPQQGVFWVKKRRAAGVTPSIYCNEKYGLPSVRAAFRYWGVAEPPYWVANYDGVALLRPGEVARQYANPTLTGHPYDKSIVADYWPGVDGLHGGGSGSLTGDDMNQEEHDALMDLQKLYTLRNKPVPVSVPGGETMLDWFTRWDVQLRGLVTAGVKVDETVVLAAIADIKAHPGIDPAVVAKIDALSKHLGIGTP